MVQTVYKLPFRLIGIPVHLDLTFLLALPLLTWLIGTQMDRFAVVLGLGPDSESLTQGMRPYLLGLLAAVALFASVLAHELGHSVVGRHFNLKIRSITLWILGGMAQFEMIPRKKGTEAIMAIAGPITSLVVGFSSWLLFHLTPEPFAGTRFVLAYVMHMNIILATFNLLPALPLDGGRVFRSLLALRVPYLRATQIAAATSKFLALVLGFLGVVFLNIWMILIAFFIYIAVTGESEYATVSTMLKGIEVEDLMTRDVVTVSSETRVSDLVQRMFLERHLSFPVLDSGSRLVGFVTLQDVRQMKASGRREAEATVGEIMTRNVERIGEHESAFEAFQRIGRSKTGRLVVVDNRERLIGLISKTDLIRAVQVRTVESLENGREKSS
jgi:Zn-dependent protease/CBS domain-containing protein